MLVIDPPPTLASLRPTVTQTNVTMLDVMVLRLSELVGKAQNFKEASAWAKDQLDFWDM